MKTRLFAATGAALLVGATILPAAAGAAPGAATGAAAGPCMATSAPSRGRTVVTASGDWMPGSSFSVIAEKALGSPSSPVLLVGGNVVPLVYANTPQTERWALSITGAENNTYTVLAPRSATTRQSLELILSGEIPEAVSGQQVRVATCSIGAPGTSNSTAQAMVRVSPVNLSKSRVSTPSPMLRYVASTSDSMVKGSMLTDVLPVAVEPELPLPKGMTWDANRRMIRWSIDSVGPDRPVVAEVKLKPPPVAASDGRAPRADKSTTSTSTDPVGPVSIIGSVDKSTLPALPGGKVAINLNVTVPAGTTGGVVVRQVLPLGWTLAGSASGSVGPMRCDTGLTARVPVTVPGTVGWSLNAPQALGSPAACTTTVQVAVPADAADGQSYDFQAETMLVGAESANPLTPGPNIQRDSTSFSVATSRPLLRINKEADRTIWSPDSPITYTITVQNLGSADLVGVRLTDDVADHQVDGFVAPEEAGVKGDGHQFIIERIPANSGFTFSYQWKRWLGAQTAASTAPDAVLNSKMQVDTFTVENHEKAQAPTPMPTAPPTAANVAVDGPKPVLALKRTSEDDIQRVTIQNKGQAPVQSITLEDAGLRASINNTVMVTPTPMAPSGVELVGGLLKVVWPAGVSLAPGSSMTVEWKSAPSENAHDVTTRASGSGMDGSKTVAEDRTTVPAVRKMTAPTPGPVTQVQAAEQTRPAPAPPAPLVVPLSLPLEAVGEPVVVSGNAMVVKSNDGWAVQPLSSGENVTVNVPVANGIKQVIVPTGTMKTVPAFSPSWWMAIPGVFILWLSGSYRRLSDRPPHGRRR